MQEKLILRAIFYFQLVVVFAIGSIDDSFQKEFQCFQSLRHGNNVYKHYNCIG